MGKALQSLVMNHAQDGAAAIAAWLAPLQAPDGGAMAAVSSATPSMVAELVGHTLSQARTLLVVSVDDGILTGISDAIDIRIRPLCLVLPDAGPAVRVALRVSLSLLKSRLTRPDGDAGNPAWLAQRERIRDQEALWQACLSWSERGLANEDWPEDAISLFPIRVLPLALARRLNATADWVLILDAPRQPEDACGAWPGAQRTLLAGSTLATTDGADAQRDELALLTQELADLELELATAQAEIADFTRRYHRMIGARMAELDALRAELAARRAAADPENLEAATAATSAQARAEESRRQSDRFSELSPEDLRPFAPSVDLKKLYRHLAQKIHPDRAANEHDRAWRTQLMSEANRAYRAGDEKSLRELFALWQEGARPAPAGNDLPNQIERLKRRIVEIETELKRLFGSRLYELFIAEGIARRTGRDLLQEMAERLDADIAAVRAQSA